MDGASVMRVFLMRIDRSMESEHTVQYPTAASIGCLVTWLALSSAKNIVRQVTDRQTTGRLTGTDVTTDESRGVRSKDLDWQTNTANTKLQDN